MTYLLFDKVCSPPHLYPVLNAADREMMELQRRLSNYRGTLTGKKLLKQGPVRKCTRKGAKKEVYLFLVS